MSKPLVYCGRATYKLARAVTRQLGVKLGELDIRCFADTEPWYRVPHPKKINGQNVFLIQSTSEYAPTTYFDLWGIMDALRRQKPKKLVVILPFMGFRRQEKVCEEGEAVTAELMARFTSVAGASEVVLCDPHAEITLSYFQDVPVRVIDANATFVRVLKGQDRSQYIAVTPDAGRKDLAFHFAELLSIPLVEAGKYRADHDRVGNIQIKEKDKGKIPGKIAIIREDEISTGETIQETVRVLAKTGAAHTIIMATHGVLAGGAVQKLKANHYIKKVYITDSIYLPWEKRDPKIHRLSLAPAIAQLIKEMNKE